MIRDCSSFRYSDSKRSSRGTSFSAREPRLIPCTLEVQLSYEYSMSKSRVSCTLSLCQRLVHVDYQHVQLATSESHELSLPAKLL